MKIEFFISFHRWVGMYVIHLDVSDEVIVGGSYKWDRDVIYLRHVNK
jgi:hypothetical protein